MTQKMFESRLPRAEASLCLPWLMTGCVPSPSRTALRSLRAPRVPRIPGVRRRRQLKPGGDLGLRREAAALRPGDDGAGFLLPTPGSRPSSSEPRKVPRKPP